jgi:sulfonate transport system substrate-binding protein
MRSSPWLKAALFAAVLGLLAAAPAERAAGQAPAEYTFATVNNMNHLPEFVGVEKGIFIKHGIDLKIKVLNTGAEVMRAFNSGQAQFMPQSPTIQAAAANNGIKLIAVAGLMGDPTHVYYDDMFAITARKGSGIRPGHVEDLIGKRVGMVLGGTGEEYLRAVLAKKGIPADKVTFVNVPPPNHVSVMQNNSVDAEVTWEPYGTMILDQVPGAYLVQRGGGYIGYTLWIGSSQDFVSKNPGATQKLVDAFAEAEWYVRNHHAEAAQIATHWIEGLDAKSAEKAIAYMGFDPRFSPNIIKAADLEQEGILKLGRIKQGVDFNQTTTMVFVDKAMHDEPQYFKDLKPIK